MYNSVAKRIWNPKCFSLLSFFHKIIFKNSLRIFGDIKDLVLYKIFEIYLIGWLLSKLFLIFEDNLKLSFVVKVKFSYLVISTLLFPECLSQFCSYLNSKWTTLAVATVIEWLMTSIMICKHLIRTNHCNIKHEAFRNT